MNDNFLCQCGHRNRMHTSLEDAMLGYRHTGRMCVEYKDAIHVNGKWYHSKEEICRCGNFVPDNLKTLEELSGSTKY